MAPSAIETAPAGAEVVVPKYAIHKGVYKELATNKLDLETEKAGKNGFQAAKVRATPGSSNC